MASSLLLILRVSLHDSAAQWLVGAMVARCVLYWVAIPLWARHTNRA